MALPNQSFIFSSVILIDEEKHLVEKQATDSNENLLPDRPASRRKMMRRRSSTSGALLVQKDADQKGLVSTHKTLCVSGLLPLSGFYFWKNWCHFISAETLWICDSFVAKTLSVMLAHVSRFGLYPQQIQSHSVLKLSNYRRHSTNRRPIENKEIFVSGYQHKFDFLNLRDFTF